MIKLVKQHFFFALLIIAILFFFSKVLFGLLPIPSDTIIGLYHPFRDLYAKDYPNGIPFKNFLITDPVRQIYPWKELSVELLSKLQMPTWNPYEMAGKPLIGNFQSSPFYPLNIFLFIKPFYLGWSVFIILQIFLCAIFMFAYLRNLKLGKSASVLGAVAFSFSGFAISWLEWGNVVHTALWLPLILLAIDKTFEHYKEVSSIKYQVLSIPVRQAQGRQIKNKKLILWFLVLLFSLVSSFLAGHLQVFFYVLIFGAAYLAFRWFEFGKKLNVLILFAICFLLFAIVTAVQWIPTLQFINLSARGMDLDWHAQGWFIPWRHLIQFIFPDFFGNPTTLNYWGIWNYAEFVGYIGIIPLLFSFYSIFNSKLKEKYFFFGALIVSLIFALPNPIAEIPFKLGIPLISSSQPTRLIFIASFSLSVLAAFGFSYYSNILKNIGTAEKRTILIPLGIIGIGIIALFIFTIIGGDFGIEGTNLAVAKRNLIFPTIIFISASVLILISVIVKNPIVKKSVIVLLLLIVAFDLLRFSDKFSTFTKKEYLFPNTKTLEFLKKDKEIFRVVSNDSRILPPNFLTHYRIQTIEGYDPLYLLSYGQLIAASERGEPNIKPPYGFNRIITPHNLSSKIIDLLNVKYVFSLSPIEGEKFELVFEEGQTKTYRNRNYIPRVFFAEQVVNKSTAQEQVSEMFVQNLSKVAITEDFEDKENLSLGKAVITKYSENELLIEAENFGDGFLVLTDAYYPTWRAFVDGEKVKIYKTNYNFRGLLIPKGRHEIVYKNNLF